jgi:hypothetical protein
VLLSWAWWYTSVIPAFGKLRQEDSQALGLPGLYSKILSQKKKKYIYIVFKGGQEVICKLI